MTDWNAEFEKIKAKATEQESEKIRMRNEADQKAKVRLDALKDVLLTINAITAVYSVDLRRTITDAHLVGDWVLTIRQGSFIRFGIGDRETFFEIGRLEMGYYDNEYLAYSEIFSLQDDLIRYILSQLAKN